jgi:quinol monooxygenase YgiN
MPLTAQSKSPFVPLFEWGVKTNAARIGSKSHPQHSKSKRTGLMIHSTIRIALAPEKLAEVVGILRAMAERTRADPGCLACHVYQDVQDARVLMLEELWKTPADLTRHLRGEQYRKVLLVMEMAGEPPEVRFNAISHSTGVETIEQARLGRLDT